MTFRFFRISLILMPFLLFSCFSGVVTKRAMIFRTSCSINIYEGGGCFKFKKEDLIDKCFDDLRQLDLEVDAVDPKSQLNRLVSTADQSGATLKLKGFRKILYDKSMEYAEIFKGAFDPSVAPLVKLWNIGFGDEKVPMQKEILGSLEKVGYQQWQGGRVPKGGQLDFGASAKGLAAQLVKNRLEHAGVKSAVIVIGGNITVLGRHPEGRLWKIGVLDPQSKTGKSLLLLDLEDLSASTSGIYERNFTADGKLYHHLLDPRTGYPASGGLASVTVVSVDALLTDICSTGLFVLGKKEGEQMALQIKGIEALFIDTDGKISITKGLKKSLHFLDKNLPLSYRVIVSN